MNSFTIIIFKIEYSEYLKNYKNLRYLDDIDLKMFKKSEIFKYKNNNEYIYDQYICVTENKKIILKTKHNKYEEFSSLADYIANESTTLKDILNYMNENIISEIKVQCILTIKDFESNLNSNQNNLNYLCLRGYEDGLINKFGSIFKVLKLTNKKILFENLSGIPIYSLHANELNSKNINKNNQDLKLNDDIETIDNLKFRIYQTEEINLQNFENKFIENFINKNEYKEKNIIYSSFLEVSTSNKFYSNDLLIKIEDGMNHITEKIIDSSKKISELSKYIIFLY